MVAIQDSIWCVRAGRFGPVVEQKVEACGITVIGYRHRRHVNRGYLETRSGGGLTGCNGYDDNNKHDALL